MSKAMPVIIAFFLNLLLGAGIGALFMNVLFGALWLFGSAPPYAQWFPFVVIIAIVLSVSFGLNYLILYVKWRKKFGLR